MVERKRERALCEKKKKPCIVQYFKKHSKLSFFDLHVIKINFKVDLLNRTAAKERERNENRYYVMHTHNVMILQAQKTQIEQREGGSKIALQPAPEAPASRENKETINKS
jgi:hypothetical protein